MGKCRDYICETCGKVFQSNKGCRTRTPRFCSSKCAGKANAKIKTCAWCGKQFYNWTREKYCCKECASAALRGVPLSEEHRRKLSEARKASPKCHGENLYNWKGGDATYKERMKLHNQKRRTLQKIRPDIRYLSILKRAQKNRCFYCDCDMGINPSLEHLTPVSRGGDNQSWNLVYACKSCNSKKHNSTLEEFTIKTGKAYLLDKYDMIIARVYSPYMERIKIGQYEEGKNNSQNLYPGSK